MAIRNITHGELIKHVSSKQPFHVGQIVQGEILKIFANNKVQLRIGTEELFAELKAPLTIGERYHLQVRQVDHVVVLQIVGEKLKNNEYENSLHLLKQLRIKTTPETTRLLFGLRSEQLTFTSDQLKQAAHLLSHVDSSQKGTAIQVLLEMIATRMPLTKTVFSALMQTRTTDITSQLQNMLAEATAHRDNGALLANLNEQIKYVTSNYVIQKQVVAEQIIKDILTDNKQFFNYLKSAALINEKFDFAMWKKVWQTFLKTNNDSFKSNEYIANEGQVNERFFPPVPVERILTTLVTQTGLINESLFERDGDNQTERQIQHFIQRVFSHTMPNRLQMNIQKQFFYSYLKQYIEMMGLTYENELWNKQMIKSTLIQMQEQGQLNKSANQLLSLINGMQLQSVIESEHFVHAILQLPGNSFKLPDDILLKFSSQKNESNKIDSDFCRILFCLQLHTLKETIIEMNVQNRCVTMTIYNDMKHLKPFLDKYKGILSEGLAQLQYKLSSITLKPLSDLQAKKTDMLSMIHEKERKGIDLQI